MKIETTLIEACKQEGNQLKKKELYYLLLPYLRAVGVRYLRNPNYIKDVLQEAFANIFRSINQFDQTKGVFHKWAVRITINSALKYNQRVSRSNQEQLDIEKHDIEFQTQPIEQISDETLLRILKRMPLKNAEVFNLYIIDGYSHKEISEMLSISEMNSRKKLSRARGWLQENFQSKFKVIIGKVIAK